jgi:hypothetical protein
MFLSLRRHLSYANVMATVAVFLALGGTTYAAFTLPRNSVGTKQLKNGAVTGAKVRRHSLLGIDFKAGQLPAGATGARGAAGPQGPQGLQGPKGDTGPSGVADIYDVSDPITVPASGVVRDTPMCNSGDIATGGGYFLNRAGLTPSQEDVEVFSDEPAGVGNTTHPPGWDIGIFNKTTTQRTGFALAVCAHSG